MLLSARFLNDVASVNSFEPANNLEFHKGSAQTVYLQTIDKSIDLAIQGFNPSGRRYCAPLNSTMMVQFVNLLDSKKILRPATQPFSLDASIWAIPIYATDPLEGTVTLVLALTTPSGPISATITAGLLVCG